jgi:hypothetical protein
MTPKRDAAEPASKVSRRKFLAATAAAVNGATLFSFMENAQAFFNMGAFLKKSSSSSSVGNWLSYNGSLDGASISIASGAIRPIAVKSVSDSLAVFVTANAPSSTWLKAQTISISGTTLTANAAASVATEASWFAGNQQNLVMLSSTKLVLFWAVDASTLKAAVLTLSGTTVSVGPVQTLATNVLSGNIGWTTAQPLSSNSIFLAFGSSNSGTPAGAYIVTESSGTLTLGTAAPIADSYSATVAVGILSSTTAILAYTNSTKSANGWSTVQTFKVATISGSTISFGASAMYDTGLTGTLYSDGRFNVINTTQAVFMCQEFYPLTISGSNVSIGTHSSCLAGSSLATVAMGGGTTPVSVTVYGAGYNSLRVRASKGTFATGACSSINTTTAASCDPSGAQPASDLIDGNRVLVCYSDGSAAAYAKIIKA